MTLLKLRLPKKVTMPAMLERRDDQRREARPERAVQDRGNAGASTSGDRDPDKGGDLYADAAGAGVAGRAPGGIPDSQILFWGRSSGGASRTGSEGEANAVDDAPAVASGPQVTRTILRCCRGSPRQSTCCLASPWQNTPWRIFTQIRRMKTRKTRRWSPEVDELVSEAVAEAQAVVEPMVVLKRQSLNWPSLNR